MPPGLLRTILKRYISYTVLEFDSDKSRQNAAKIGMDFVEAQAMWDGWCIYVASNHNALEPRELVIGRINDRIWTAIITRRGDNIRIISVRRARQNEEQIYERSNDKKD